MNVNVQFAVSVILCEIPDVQLMFFEAPELPSSMTGIVGLVGPVTPVGPVEPVLPVGPVGPPEGPVAPVAPVEVADPGAPVFPVAPVGPVIPVGPVPPPPAPRSGYVSVPYRPLPMTRDIDHFRTMSVACQSWTTLYASLNFFACTSGCRSSSALSTVGLIEAAKLHRTL